MINYREPRVELTNTQLNKLKSATKHKTETMLRLNKKNYIKNWHHKNHF